MLGKIWKGIKNIWKKITGKADDAATIAAKKAKAAAEAMSKAKARAKRKADEIEKSLPIPTPGESQDLLEKREKLMALTLIAMNGKQAYLSD